jgi:hypothetical protein
MKFLRDFSLTNISALHIATFCTLAISHPLYDLLTKGDHATFFLAHQSKATDIYLFVLVLSVAVPVAVYLLLRLCSLLSRRTAQGLFTTVIFFLVVLLFLPISERLFGDSFETLNIVITLTVSLVATLLYISTSWAKSFVTVMSLAVIVSPLLFLTNPDIRSFLSSPEAQDNTITPGNKNLPNIVMVVFDELPIISLLSDNRLIDEVLFPNFARLAKTSTWYRNAATAYSSTKKAMPSILTGKYSKTAPNGIVGKKQIPENLLTFFEKYYQVNAIESVTEFVPNNATVEAYLPNLSERLSSLMLDSSIIISHNILPNSLSKNLPTISGQWQNFSTNDAPKPNTNDNWPYQGPKPEKVRNFLKLLQKTNHPTLSFLHLVLPHFPFIYNDDGRQNGSQVNRLGGAAKGTGQGRFAKHKETSAIVYQAHLLQTRFVDRLLGLILDKMQSQNIFEDALIIVTADHGGGFYWGEGLSKAEMAPIREHEIMYVPLFIKSPKQNLSVISDKPVLNIDILPTIASILDVEIPWKVEGVSALTNIPLDQKRHAFIPFKVEVSDEFPFDSPALNAKIELFGTRSLEKLYAFGPHQELLNRKLDALGYSSSTIELKFKRDYEKSNIRRVHPTFYIEGTLSRFPPGKNPSDLELAIAINGIIRSTTKTFEEDGETHFLTRVPPESWVEGKNKITVHGIVEDVSAKTASLINFTNTSD